MEIQWPLILFTTLLSASAGVFGAQGVYAIVKRGAAAQMKALITSAVLLVLGGISVFFHLTHPDRLFNGFGHITSGITQELIAIVVMAVVMVAFFAVLRREGGEVPTWMGVLAIVSAVALIIVMGHSYEMPSRPAWNSVLQIASLLGAACAMGVGAFAFLDAEAEDDASVHGNYALAGSAVNVVASIAYVIAASSTVTAFTQVGFYFDPNHPTLGISEAEAYSPLFGSTMGYTVGALIFVVAALAFAFAGKKTGNWRVYGAACAVCGLIGALLLRVMFYCVGGSVFMFY